MIKRLYKWFHSVTSRPEEAGEYSAGYWPDKVRRSALDLCAHKRGRILDVGCGEGLFLSKLALSNSGAEIWGIDKWDGILKRAIRYQLVTNFPTKDDLRDAVLIGLDTTDTGIWR